MAENEILALILDEIKSMKSEMQGMKSDMQGMKAVMATKDDIESVRAEIKATKYELYDEIVRAEKEIDKVRESVKDLNDKYNTLLLKEDNTALLLRLINGLQERVSILEKKLA